MRTTIASLLGAVAIIVLCAAKPGKRDSWLVRLLKFTGLTASPTQMKAPDETAPGDVWVVDVEGDPAVQRTQDGGYQWPVFIPGTADILALKNERIVRVGSNDAGVIMVAPGSKFSKLVGFDKADPDKLLVMVQSHRSPLAVVSLSQRTSTPLPFTASSVDEWRMLEHIAGQERVYGDTTVYVKTETEAGLNRTFEWTNVYLRRADADPLDVSGCRRVDCTQPSLSPDGRAVVFIKASLER